MAVDVAAGLYGTAAPSPTPTTMTACSGNDTTDGGAGSSGMTRSGSVYRRLSGAPVVALETQHSTVTVAEEQPCCRICLETATEEEFATGKALRLGCRCSAHMDVVHTDCAERWFKLRRDTSCEICGSDAVGLPEGVRAAVRHLAAQAAQQQAALQALPANFVLFPGAAAAASGDLHLLLPPWQGAPPPPLQYVMLYLLFCLLPTCVAAAALVVWYMYLEVNVQLTVVLSILASCASMVHWLMHPRRCLMHLVLVNLMVGCIVAACWVMERSAEEGHISMTTNVLAVAGTVVGAAIGMTLFFCIIIPGSAMLQTWLRQVWHQHSSTHGSHLSHSFAAATATQPIRTSTNAPGDAAADTAHLSHWSAAASAADGSHTANTVGAVSGSASGRGQGDSTSGRDSTTAEYAHVDEGRVLELSVGAMWWAHA